MKRPLSPSSPIRRGGGVFLLLLSGGLLLTLWTRRDQPEEKTSPALSSQPAPDLPDPPFSAVSGSDAPESPSSGETTPMVLAVAEDFAAAENSPEKNLALLLDVLHGYDRILKNEHLPTGLNEDYLRALTGQNSERLEFFPHDHPRIDQEGRLLDDWSTPYFFHSLSVKEVEIVSAGPDRILFTEDDLKISNSTR